jgi:hypothetical protein
MSNKFPNFVPIDTYRPNFSEKSKSRVSFRNKKTDDLT